MMEAIIVYDNNKDRELLELIDSKFPIFIHYINFNTVKGRKEAYRIKSEWGAKMNPFVVIEHDSSETLPQVFYTESGSNAIQQLINYLNDYKN